MHCPVLLAGCRGAGGSSADRERRPAGTVALGPGCGTAPRQGKGWVGPGWMGQGSDCEFTADELWHCFCRAASRQPRLKSCRATLACATGICCSTPPTLAGQAQVRPPAPQLLLPALRRGSPAQAGNGGRCGIIAGQCRGWCDSHRRQRLPRPACQVHFRGEVTQRGCMQAGRPGSTFVMGQPVTLMETLHL